MATAVITSQDFVNAIALEVASKIDVGVGSWMAGVENALNDPALTTLGRMNAAKEVLAQYKILTGKQQLQSRKVLAA